MQNLQDICDVPISYDDEEDSFNLPIELKLRNKRTIMLESLTPTLLNRSISYPKKVYDEYSVDIEEGIANKLEEQLNYDLMAIPSGLLGIEYIKSHVFYSPISAFADRIRYSTIVEGIQGETTIIMQKNVYTDVHPTVQEGIIIELKPREKVGIPEGYFYTFINTGERSSLISRIYKSYNKVDYSCFKTQGLAYFCIRKNAKLELVYNPCFKDVPRIKRVKQFTYGLPDILTNSEQSLYTILKLNTEILVELLAD